MNVNMKTLAVLCLSCALVPAAFADEATKNAKIEELLKLTNADRMVSQMFDQMKSIEMNQLNSMNIAPDQRALVQQTQEQILQLLQNALSWDKLKPALVKVYTETFTEEEIDGILNFYKTPAGQALLQKMPTLIQRSMQTGQQMVADVLPQIQKMTEDLKRKAAGQQGESTTPPH
jgi:uncharacterized protein